MLSLLLRIAVLKRFQLRNKYFEGPIQNVIAFSALEPSRQLVWHCNLAVPACLSMRRVTISSSAANCQKRQSQSKI